MVNSVKLLSLYVLLVDFSALYCLMTLQYSLIPQYVSKLKRLQMEMQEIQDKSKDLKERAAEVQVMKTKTLAADAHLLAKPANTQKK